MTIFRNRIPARAKRNSPKEKPPTNTARQNTTRITRTQNRPHPPRRARAKKNERPTNQPRQNHDRKTLPPKIARPKGIARTNQPCAQREGAPTTNTTTRPQIARAPKPTAAHRGTPRANIGGVKPYLGAFLATGPPPSVPPATLRPSGFEPWTRNPEPATRHLPLARGHSSTTAP